MKGVRFIQFWHNLIQIGVDLLCKCLCDVCKIQKHFYPQSMVHTIKEDERLKSVLRRQESKGKLGTVDVGSTSAMTETESRRNDLSMVR